YHEPIGAPMGYRAAKGFFDRLAAECGFAVRPHILRHTAATNWEASDVAKDASFDMVRDRCAIREAGFSPLAAIG
ncbi:MAG: hypothetical protein ACRD1K_06150, partial [Acidimicrobiales bacterium]